jgi:rubredoxin
MRRVPSSSGTRNPVLGGTTNLKQAGQSKVNDYVEQMRLKKEHAARLREERKMREDGDDYIPPPVAKPSTRVGSGDVLGRTNDFGSNGRQSRGETNYNSNGYKPLVVDNGRSSESSRTATTKKFTQQDSEDDEDDRYSSAIKSVTTTQKTQQNRTPSATTPTSSTSTRKFVPSSKPATNSRTTSGKLTPYDLLHTKITLKSGSSRMDTEEDEPPIQFVPRQSKPVANAVTNNGNVRQRQAPVKAPVRQDPMSEDDSDDDARYEPTPKQTSGRPQPLQQTKQPQRAQSQPQQNPKNIPSGNAKPSSAPPVNVNTSASFAQMKGNNPTNDISEYPEEEDEEDREACRVCGRKFRAEIIDKHQVVCAKNKNKKVKKFKVSVIPDELIADAKKAQRESALIAKTQPKPKPLKMPKWKMEHEQFMAVLKANKTGAPVPTNPDLDDRIECPTCGRKFGETAAERHIAKCGGIMNKPSFLKRGNGLAGGNLGKTPTSPVKATTSKLGVKAAPSRYR